MEIVYNGELDRYELHRDGKMLNNMAMPHREDLENHIREWIEAEQEVIQQNLNTIHEAQQLLGKRVE